ncbi:hypothetical protein [Lactobacillus delbrueckii]|uniref:hypothetical protein n=1 Tax=Lactobacillus delbrueckii TaxID=1584 RepID=UPI0022EBFFFF|nr:hypothetical protein [Lactobacillus delbrueckii]MDA3784375.1 hypothetical protein [Lactobacillus delbrueckii]
MAEKKEALATATAKAAATLHALNLAKARLAALEATQPTDRTQRLNDRTDYRAVQRTFYRTNR